MNIEAFHPTQRYCNRVEQYVKSRPSYPSSVISFLNKEINLYGKTVADIGSGTGIFTRLLLENGNKVFAIEPNEEMRKVAVDLSASYPHVECVASTAEDIPLPDKSVDVITTAQAFHWFNTDKAIQEFYRILKLRGTIVLLWNELKNQTEFRRDYEKLFKQYSPEYCTINHNIDEDSIQHSFHPFTVKKEIFANTQILHLDQFIDRLLSSSFSPDPQDHRYAPFLEQAHQIFKQHQKEDQIEILYETYLFYVIVDRAR